MYSPIQVHVNTIINFNALTHIYSGKFEKLHKKKLSANVFLYTCKQRNSTAYLIVAVDLAILLGLCLEFFIIIIWCFNQTEQNK